MAGKTGSKTQGSKKKPKELQQAYIARGGFIFMLKKTAESLLMDGWKKSVQGLLTDGPQGPPGIG